MLFQQIPRARGALYHFIMSILPERIASIAESKIGIRETGGANKGTALAEFFAADDYRPSPDHGYAWCAAFVCRIVQLAMEGRQWTFERPRSAGAWRFEDWSLAQDASTWTKKNPGLDIKRGDLVIFKISHIGIAVSDADANGGFFCVEGNTGPNGGRDGDGVYKKNRHTNLVKTRIRFRV